MVNLKDFTPRLYQETILNTCVNKNTLVVLPTGMGKTAIALLLAAQRINNYPNSKILFLAPTKPLAEQHMNYFKRYIEDKEESFALFTGLISPDIREKLWKETKYIFSTPQCVTGDTKIFVYGKGPISIKDFVENLPLKKCKYANKKGYCAEINEKVIGFKDKKIIPLKAIKAYKLPTNELIEIKTEMSGVLKCTVEHPLISIDSLGDIKWVEAQNLKKGYYVGMIKEISIKKKKD